MKIRLIIYSEISGANESVIFTEDFDKDVQDFIPSMCTVDFDRVINAELPSSFPTEHVLANKLYIQ